jgi:tetratricopeptide (TPR) repeat protein
LSKLAFFVFAVCLLAQSSPEAHLAGARKAELSGDFALAEREYEQALALRPDAETYQRLGLVRHLQNKFKEAIPAFEQSLKLQPKQWSSRLFLGIGLYRTNQFEPALGELKQADKLRPNDPEVRKWLGLTYLARKEYLTGLAILEELSREQPKDLELLRVLAENYAIFGTTLLNNVAEKHPDTPAGLEVHAQALEFEGANEAALDVYRQLQRMEPNRRGLNDAIERLKAAPSAKQPPSPGATSAESPTPP